VVHAIVQLGIVVDLVLSILVTTSSCELEQFLLVLHGCHLESLLEELVYVRHRRVEGGQYQRLLRGVAQGAIHRVQVELCEAVPGLFIRLYLFVAVESARIVVRELAADDLFFFVFEDVLA
jgi:hypothetical protein